MLIQITIAKQKQLVLQMTMFDCCERNRKHTTIAFVNVANVERILISPIWFFSRRLIWFM
jgi:hypothetical protein